MRIWVVGKAQVERGGGSQHPASLFPGLCKGLIKYRWYLEQSRGNWESTNRQAVMEPCCLFRLICSPFSFIHCLPPLSSILHFPPCTSFPTFLSPIICICLSNSRVGTMDLFSQFGLFLSLLDDDYWVVRLVHINEEEGFPSVFTLFIIDFPSFQMKIICNVESLIVEYKYWNSRTCLSAWLLVCAFVSTWHWFNNFDSLIQTKSISSTQWHT